MFVHQASSPEAAREAIQTLMMSPLDVVYKDVSVHCTIAAEPWRGEDIGPLGLDWQFTANDVMLWGGCAGGLLTMCSIGACCVVQLSSSKESKRADQLLRKDRALFKKYLTSQHINGDDEDADDLEKPHHKPHTKKPAIVKHAKKVKPGNAVANKA